MTDDVLSADHRALHDHFVDRLNQEGAEGTLAWLAHLLPQQSASLRAQNCSYLAYTGRREGLTVLENLVGSPVTESWGSTAALLGASWKQIAAWLSLGGPHRLMALDALLAYRAPAPNMAPLAQIAAPVLPDTPSGSDFDNALAAVLLDAPSPRVQKAVRSIRHFAQEILGRENRGVAVEDLPRLYLAPDGFPGAKKILDRHEEVTSGIRQSIQDLVSKLP